MIVKTHLCTLQAIIQLPVTAETELSDTRAPQTGRDVVVILPVRTSNGTILPVNLFDTCLQQS